MHQGTRMSDRGVVTDLNAEWERLVESTHRLPGWVDHPSLVGCHDLHDVLAAVRGAPDSVLLVLLEATRDGDDLAPRVVLQAMLPKMVLMALRDRGAGVADYVAQLWCVVVAYPVDRRRTKVAANLALDTLKQVAGERLRGPVPTSYDQLGDAVRIDATPAPGSEAEHLLVSAHDLRLLDRDTTAILRAVYLDGLTSREAAARHGGSAEMVRYRCSRAVRQLAGHSVELAAA